MRSDGFVLTVALARPGRVLSPNSRSHWAAKQRVVREARGRARLLVLKALGEGGAGCPASSDLVQGRSTPRLRASETPALRYEVRWFYKGACPDADNCLASCKAYLDGCADALGVDDRTLECAGIHRVHDKGRAGTVEIVFYG